MTLPPRATLPVLEGHADRTRRRAPAPMFAVAAVACCIGSVTVALAQSDTKGAFPSLLGGVIKWLPLIFGGFVFNLIVSVCAMALGTVLGFGLGIGLVGTLRWARSAGWGVTQFFRNAPWLVILFYVMFLFPFQIRIGGITIPVPDAMKSIIGLALPVMANVAEIVRGGILSIPAAQWEAADSLGFTRRQTLWGIILPQSLKRMLPPWMNLYAILTMSTPLISIVGVQDGLTLTRSALVAEAKPELLIPMYLALLCMFFAYCYPIARATRALEKRFDVGK